MGTRAGDCNGGGIAGDLSGWGPFGEDFRLFDSDGRKTVLGRWAGGAEVDRPLGTCGCCMNERNSPPVLANQNICVRQFLPEAPGRHAPQVVFLASFLSFRAAVGWRWCARCRR